MSRANRKGLDGDKYLGLLCLGPVCRTDPHPAKLTAAGSSRKFEVARHTSEGPFIDCLVKFAYGGPSWGQPVAGPRRGTSPGL